MAQIRTCRSSTLCQGRRHLAAAAAAQSGFADSIERKGSSHIGQIIGDGASGDLYSGLQHLNVVGSAGSKLKEALLRLLQLAAPVTAANRKSISGRRTAASGPNGTLTQQTF